MAEEQDPTTPDSQPEKKPPRAKKPASTAKMQTEPVSKRWADAGPDDEFVITSEEIAVLAAMWSSDDDRPGRRPKNADGRRFFNFWRSR